MSDEDEKVECRTCGGTGFDGAVARAVHPLKLKGGGMEGMYERRQRILGMRERGMTLAQIAEIEGVSAGRVRQIAVAAMRDNARAAALGGGDFSAFCAGLSARAQFALDQSGVRSFEGLADLTMDDLWGIPGVGRKSVMEIVRAAKDLGFSILWRNKGGGDAG